MGIHVQLSSERRCPPEPARWSSLVRNRLRTELIQQATCPLVRLTSPAKELAYVPELMITASKKGAALAEFLYCVALMFEGVSISST